MFTGVMFFSVTIGSLTSLISDMDTKNIAYEKKLTTLIQINKEFNISSKMMKRVQLALKYGIFKADENYNNFLNELPESLRVELGYSIYRKDLDCIGLLEEQLNVKEIYSCVGPHLQKVRFN